MLNVVLYEPEIPPNTGNLIRLCANCGAILHLIEPLGFSMETKALRRAGLDYHEAAQVRVWPTLEACLAALGVPQDPPRNPSTGSTPPVPLVETKDRSKEGLIPAAKDNGAARPQVWAATSHGDRRHTSPRYRAGDILLFGPESRGLPREVVEDPRVSARIRIPMRAGSRSLNLSNAVSVVVYEAWRQLDFAGAVR